MNNIDLVSKILETSFTFKTPLNRGVINGNQLNIFLKYEKNLPFSDEYSIITIQLKNKMIIKPPIFPMNPHTQMNRELYISFNNDGYRFCQRNITSFSIINKNDLSNALAQKSLRVFWKYKELNELLKNLYLELI